MAEAKANTAPRKQALRGGMTGGLMAVGLWGLAPVATRAVVSHISPLSLLTLRLGLAALVLLPWATPVFRRLRLRPAGRLLAAGLLGLVGYNLPVTVGLQWLPASTAGLLLATEPIWVMVLGCVFSAERFRARAWLGSAIALGGVGLLAGPGALSGAAGGRAAAGAGLVLAGTLAFGAYTIVLRPLSQAYGAVPATAASTVAGTLPYLAFAGTLSVPQLAQLPPAAWAELGFLALGSTVAGMLLWNRAVLSAGTTRVSLLLYLEPAVSVLGAAAFLGENVTPATIAGGLLILSGVAAAGRALTTAPKSPSSDLHSSAHAAGRRSGGDMEQPVSPPPPGGSFGALLRARRHQALLSQEQLAARAGLSVRTVRELEADRVLSPRPDTVRLLADALQLTGPQRTGWVTAYHQRAGPWAPRAGGPGAPLGDAPARLLSAGGCDTADKSRRRRSPAGEFPAEIAALVKGGCRSGVARRLGRVLPRGRSGHRRGEWSAPIGHCPLVR